MGESESAAARGEIRSVLSDPRELPRAASGTVRVLFGLIQLMYLIFYAFTLARLAEVEAIVSVAGAAAHWIWVGSYCYCGRRNSIPALPARGRGIQLSGTNRKVP